MKKILSIFAGILMTGLILFPGCAEEKITWGTLSVTVLDFYTGLPINNEQVYLATSFTNMKQGIYFRDAWTNALGTVYFTNLSPLVYYYDTKNWQDWGAAQVYAGYDHYVYLFVNTPADKKK